MSSRGALRLAGVSAVAVACLAGCGGDGVIEMVTPPPGPAVRLSDLQDAVFTPRCAFAGCHAGPGAPFGLDLTAGLTHGNLVGVASAELPSFLRVAPGSAAASYLVMKLEGDSRIVDERMPFGSPALGDATIGLVRRWIDAGAADD